MYKHAGAVKKYLTHSWCPFFKIALTYLWHDAVLVVINFVRQVLFNDC